MGTRGPAPTPTAFLNARGSWRAGLNDGEVEYSRERPRCPSFLTPAARKEWRRLIPLLEAAGVLQSVDRALLAAWCEAWADFATVTDQLAGSSMVIATAAGDYKVNPLVKIKHQATDRLLRLAAQFGFSPAARTRIKAKQGEEDADGKARYFSTVG